MKQRMKKGESEAGREREKEEGRQGGRKGGLLCLCWGSKRTCLAFGLLVFDLLKNLRQVPKMRQLQINL